MSNIYRPWGPLRWVIEKVGKPNWALLGSHSVEERCEAVLKELPKGSSDKRLFLKIVDPDAGEKALFDKAYALREANIISIVGNSQCFEQVPLLATLDLMKVHVDKFLLDYGEDVILDISAMPKRWFFPLLKILIGDEKVKNLIIAYASAVKYSKELSFNPEPLAPIPAFAGIEARSEHETAIVGIGFEPLGLRELYSQQKVSKVRYIFPFPPGPPGFYRNWEFVRRLEEAISDRDDDRHWHMSMYDCPSIFDELVQVSEQGSSPCVLAPYGPKTVSLAMCLFSIALEEGNLVEAPVYYAQPRRYAHDYSEGIKTAAGVPDIQAYCVKLNGRQLYTI